MIREIVKIDEEKCTGCGLCVPACAEGAIQIINGKAKLISDNLCDGLGACLGDCPEDAITIEHRDADEFDEEAVEEHLAQLAPPEPSGCGCQSAEVKVAPVVHHGGHGGGHGGGCPSARLKSFEAKPAGDEEAGSRQSQLRQWPVQLHLVPPTAPFLQGADVMLAADCVPFAYADFHKDFLKGKALLIACPKLDNTAPYIEKLTAMIQQSQIRSLTVAHMEVPCCSGLIQLARQAIAASGIEVPFKTINFGIQGNLKG
jgi:Pyruvate/2-oxoacid:ferredoxin oxidoreductase delta subunit